MAENVPPSTPPPGPPPSGGDWAKSTLWMVVAGFIALNLALFIHTCRRVPAEALDKAGQLIQKTGQALADVASAFKRGSVRTDFISYATTISGQQRLQVATLKQNELFIRQEETTTGFGYIPLPDVVVEARAPIEYTYYLDLNAPWEFVLRDGVLHVLAPPLHFNKPSIDVSALTYEVRKGRVKTTDALDNLKASLTLMAAEKARQNVPLVLENGRRQTEEFVQNWLARSFTDGKQCHVKVYFPGEKRPPGWETPLKVGEGGGTGAAPPP